MQLAKNAGFYLAFFAASILLLILEHQTHVEFFLHLAAIPLEVLVAVFIVETLLERRESKAKRQQLMYIKSYMFRSDMRSLFLANFAGLKAPDITMARIKNSSLDELRGMRRLAEEVEYQSPEVMETIIQEYAKAKPVWLNFMERAITYNFESIFLDMIYIIHFTNDYRVFKGLNPDRLFIHEAEKNEWLMVKVRKILTDGIQKFLDYAIELKEKQPQVFHDLMTDYEFSSRTAAPSFDTTSGVKQNRAGFMATVEEEIRALVDAETAAWNARDAEALVSFFHPDMVWPWPPDPGAHDPMTWIMPYGRFDRERWKRSWQEVFDTHDLVHNDRKIRRIAVSEQGDGAFAVVDVDTLWVNKPTGQPFHWKGRACKVYTKAGDRWLFFFQTGLLDYETK